MKPLTAGALAVGGTLIVSAVIVAYNNNNAISGVTFNAFAPPLDTDNVQLLEGYNELTPEDKAALNAAVNTCMVNHNCPQSNGTIAYKWGSPNDGMYGALTYQDNKGRRYNVSIQGFGYTDSAGLTWTGNPIQLISNFIKKWTNW